MRDLLYLSETQFNRIKRYFPLSHGVPGGPRVDDLRLISGIIYVIRKSGAITAGISKIEENLDSLLLARFMTLSHKYRFSPSQPCPHHCHSGGVNTRF
jgi:hypothetical protein